MTYLPHQVATADKVLAVLKKRGVCLLAGETRTGKTRTAIRALELSGAENILVLTKKQAISGWESELAAVQPTKRYTVVNYEQAHKLVPEYHVVVLDESHNFGNRGKPTQRFKAVRALAYHVPLLCLSGTPSVESLLSYYYQFGVSQYSPFNKYPNFYHFFNVWGVPSFIRLHGRQVETYSKAKPALLDVVKPYIVPLTQQQAGIVHTAQDVVHEVELHPQTLTWLATLKEDKVATIAGHDIVLDTDAKERVVLHQIESGAVKLNNTLEMLPNTEMVDYIKATWGDSPDIAIMCHYHATREKVAQHLPHCHVYSSDGHAEGVNLSHYAHFIILNSGYSGAKFVQRRDRIVNLKRDTPAIVHHIVAKGQLSAAVYKVVSKKHDFNLSLYRSLR